MKKILNISLILFCLFVVFSLNSQTYAVNEPCKGVVIRRKVLDSPDYMTTTDNKIYPGDDIIEIHIPKSMNPLPQNHVFGLYARYANSEGWVYDRWNFQRNTHLLKAEPNDQGIYFKINRDATIRIPGTAKNKKIIPQPNYLWGNEKINFSIIAENGANLQEIGNLDAVCKFDLNLEKECSAQAGYNLEQNINYVKLSFNNNSSIPSGAPQNFKFVLKNSIFDYDRPFEVDPSSNTANRQFQLTKNSSTETYFLNKTLIKLQKNNNTLCETMFFSTAQWQNKCEIKPTFQGSAPNYQFAGEFRIADIPTLLLNSQQDAWRDYNGPGNDDWNTPITIYFTVIPKDNFTKIKSDPTNPYIEGIQSVTENGYNVLLPKGSSNNSWFIINPNTNPDYKKLAQVFDGEYVAIILYAVTDLDQAGNGAIGYYILPQCSYSYKLQNGVLTELPKITPLPSKPPGTPIPLLDPKRESVCDKTTNLQHDDCIRCLNEKNGIWTGLGCISTDIGSFVASFFRIGLGIAGGIAFLFLIYGGFLVMTSAGNPETIQQGKDIITSAISGLLLIIFSVLLLQLISVDILKIPGFSKESQTGTTSTNSPYDCVTITGSQYGCSGPMQGCNSDPIHPVCVQESIDTKKNTYTLTCCNRKDP